MAYINISEQDSVCYVRLNRPDVRNAFNPEMIEEITELFKKLNKRKDLRAAVLTGEGKVFCAGADLQWMSMMVNYTFEQNRADAEQLFRMFEAIAMCALPTIGLAHGAAYGGALGMIACCDYVIAEKGTDFCFSEVKLGIAPAVISPFIMRKCNPGRALPYMISAESFDADTCKEMGLIVKVAERGDGEKMLAETVSNFKKVGPEAVRETKRLLNEIGRMDWEEQMERTTKIIAERRISSEGQEGLKSFLEKRKPSWK